MSLLQWYLLNLIASVSGNLCFLTQLIRFYSLLFFDTISWILSLKNSLLTKFLKFFQSVLDLKIWYTDISLLYSSFHHTLECSVILICLEYLLQSSSVADANSCVILSSDSQSEMLVVSICPTLFFAILDNILFSVLNWFFFNNDIDRQRSVVRRIA